MNTRHPLLNPSLLAGLGGLALLAGIGLFASKPAHSAGGPIAVTVTNAPLAVTNVDSAHEVVGHTITLSSPSAGATLSGGLFIVPAGKRLVIEHLSSSTNVQSDANGYNIEVDTTQGGARVATYFNEVPDAAPYSAASQSVRLYADPGTNVLVAVYPGNKNREDLNISFSGHLENL